MGEAVDRVQMGFLFSSGWVSSPDHFNKTPEQIASIRKAEEERPKPPQEYKGQDSIILYHNEIAPYGLSVKRNLCPRLFREGWVTSPEYFGASMSFDNGVITKLDAILNKEFARTLKPIDIASVEFLESRPGGGTSVNDSISNHTKGNPKARRN
jgi:hypothetical protein